MRTRVFGGMVLALLPQMGLAQEVDCSLAQTQVDQTFCAKQDWVAADAALNAGYKIAMTAMKRIDANLGQTKGGAADALRQAQRDWVAFRDNACIAEGYPYHGGSIEPMIIFSCQARLTRVRTNDLAYLTDLD